MDDAVCDGEIWLVGEINDVSGMEVLRQLRQLGQDANNEQVTIHINSEGGIYSWSVAICSAIVASPLHVTTIVEGAACSGACLIAMCGDTRLCAFGSEYVWHGNSGGYSGTALENGALLASQKYADECQVAIAVANSNKKEKYWRRLLSQNVDGIFSASEALAIGIVDEIVGAPEPVRR